MALRIARVVLCTIGPYVRERRTVLCGLTHMRKNVCTSFAESVSPPASVLLIILESECPRVVQVFFLARAWIDKKSVSS